MQSTPRPSGRRRPPMTSRRPIAPRQTRHAYRPHDPAARSGSHQSTAPDGKVWHNPQRPKPTRRLFKSGWNCDGPENETPAATRSRPVPGSCITRLQRRRGRGVQRVLPHRRLGDDGLTGMHPGSPVPNLTHIPLKLTDRTGRDDLADDVVLPGSKARCSIATQPATSPARPQASGDRRRTDQETCSASWPGSWLLGSRGVNAPCGSITPAICVHGLFRAGIGILCDDSGRRLSSNEHVPVSPT